MSISGAALDIFCGIAIVIGIFGTLIPHLPGLILSWAGVLLWAIFTDAGSAKWWAVGVATVLALVSTVLKYVLPGRRMAKHGVPGLTLFIGTVAGIIGFFVVPVVGLFLGFVLGVYLGEQLRLKDGGKAWTSTKKALGAVGWSMAIELFTGLLAAGVWVGALALA